MIHFLIILIFLGGGTLLFIKLVFGMLFQAIVVFLPLIIMFYLFIIEICVSTILYPEGQGKTLRKFIHVVLTILVMFITFFLIGYFAL